MKPYQNRIVKCSVFILLLVWMILESTSSYASDFPIEVKLTAYHSATITGISYFPNGKHVATASKDNTIKIWDVKTGREIRTLIGFEHSEDEVETHIILLNNGKLLNAGGKTWNTMTGAIQQSLNMKYVCCKAPNKDLAVFQTGNYDLELWDIRKVRKLKSFKGHRDSVNVVMFTPDQKQIVSGSEKGDLILWDLKTGKIKQNFNGHRGGIFNIVLSPNGKYLFSTSRKKEIMVWDIQSGTNIGSNEDALDFSESKGDREEDLLDVDTMDPDALDEGSSFKLFGHSGLESNGQSRFFILQNGRYLFIRSGESIIGPFDQELARGVQFSNIAHFEGSGKCSDRGGMFIRGRVNYDVACDRMVFVGTLYVWDETKVNVKKSRCGAFSRCKESEIDYKYVRRIDLDNRKTSRKLLGEALISTPRDRSKNSSPGEFYLVTLRKGVLNNLTSFAVADTGTQVITADKKNVIRIWNSDDWANTFSIKPSLLPPVKKTYFSDGTATAFLTADDKIQIGSQLFEQYRHTVDESVSLVTSAAYSYDAKYKAVGYELGSIRISKNYGSEIVLNGHGGSVNDVHFSQDGRLLVSSSADQSIKVWELKTWKELLTLKGHKGEVNSAVFSRDNKYVFSGSNDQTIRQWSIRSKKTVRVLKGHAGAVNALAVSPDNRYLISGSDDNSVILWKVKSGKIIAKLKGHNKPVKTVRFSQNGRYAVSGGKDNVAILWDLNRKARKNSIIIDEDYDELLGHIKESAPRNKLKNVAFSPNGKSILILTTYSIVLRNIETGEVEESRLSVSRTGNPLGNVKSIMAISPKGDRFYTEGNVENLVIKHSINEWDYSNLIDRRKQVVTRYSTPNLVFKFHPVKPYLFISLNRGQAFLWDYKRKKVHLSLPDQMEYISDLSISDNGRYALTASDNGVIKRWDLSNNGKLKREFELSTESSKAFGMVKDLSVSFSDNGKNVYAAFSNKISGVKGIEIKIWSSRTGDEKTSYFIKCGFTKFALEKNLLVYSDESKGLYQYDILNKKAKKILDLPSGSLASIQVNKKRNYVHLFFQNGIDKLFNLKSGQLLATSFMNKNGDWGTVSPDGRYDKSPGFNDLYFINGLSLLDLDQFFDQFYSPTLLAEVLKSGKTGNENILARIQQQFPAPAVEIISPQSGNSRGLGVTAKSTMSNESGKVLVRVKVTSNGGGVGKVILFHNGKALENSQQRGIQVSGNNDCVNIGNRGGSQNLAKGQAEIYCFNLQLIPGQNTLKAVARSLKEIESTPWEMEIRFKAKKRLQKPDAYFVFIGISEYKNQQYNLNYAKKDAESMKLLLSQKSRNLFNKIEIVELYDKNATKSGISTALQRVTKKTRAQDLFLLFYAGHGVMLEDKEGKLQYYLVPYDVTRQYNKSKVWRMGISGKELEKVSRSIQARKQILIMDACNSGGLKDSFKFRGAAEEKALNQLNRSTGIFLLAASQEDQYAVEFEKLGHGAFTYALLAGLKGDADGGRNDGKITVKELSAYIEDAVPELTESIQGTAQYPINVGFEESQDFPLTLK